MTDQGKQPFLMAVEDVHIVAGRGLKASGSIESGAISVADTTRIAPSICAAPVIMFLM